MTPEQIASITAGLTLEQFHNWIKEQPDNTTWFNRDPCFCPIAAYTSHLTIQNDLNTIPFRITVSKRSILIESKKSISLMSQHDMYYRATITYSESGGIAEFIHRFDAIDTTTGRCDKPTVLDLLQEIGNDYERDLDIMSHSLISYKTSSASPANNWTTLADVQHRKEQPIADTP